MAACARDADAEVDAPDTPVSVIRLDSAARPLPVRDLTVTALVADPDDGVVAVLVEEARLPTALRVPRTVDVGVLTAVTVGSIRPRDR